MLVIDMDLPKGALLAEAEEPPLPRALGGLRYGPGGSAEPRLRVLHPVPEGPRAVAVEGNAEGCRVEATGGARYLAFEAGLPRGFATEAPLEMGAASLAVVFRAPEGDARTLAALCAPGSRDYLHLTVRDGAAEFAWRDAPGATVAVGDMREPVLVMASAVGGVLSIGTDRAGPVRAEAAGFAAGPWTLFIGCRRAREGLKGTLGAARVADVVLFPDVDLFGDEAAGLRAALLAHLEDLRVGL
jgi:hypothetical protein